MSIFYDAPVQGGHIRRHYNLVDLASLVTVCVYLVLCDFCQFVINIFVT